MFSVIVKAPNNWNKLISKPRARAFRTLHNIPFNMFNMNSMIFSLLLFVTGKLNFSPNCNKRRISCGIETSLKLINQSECKMLNFAFLANGSEKYKYYAVLHGSKRKYSREKTCN